MGQPESATARRDADRARAARDPGAKRPGFVSISMTPLAEVLDQARWAPSGDNTQPWRFVIEAFDHVVVLGRDTRSHCVYDLDGHPSQISLGALLETIVIAATQFGLTAHVTRREDGPEEEPMFDVHFRKDAGVAEDPLARHIRPRTVQRRPLSVKRLSDRD